MAVRSLVSKKKVRYTDADGFDLDLTYVTPRIIAMGAPSQGVEGIYRNPLTEVQRFFETKHASKYRLYDLRAEKGAAYDSKLFSSVATGFRFYDHNPPPLSLIKQCCEDMHRWLSADPEHIVAVHCKAGKGRTGLIIASYLLYSGACKSADEALRLFGDVRTSDGKGVTIPSQIRYVRYFEQALPRGDLPALSYRLTSLKLLSVPNFDPGGGCDPYLQVRLGNGKRLVFDYKQATRGKLRHYAPKQKPIELDLTPFNVRVKGDVKISFWDYDMVSEDDKMFHFWFHTGFVPEGGRLLLTKAELDRACKDKACKEFGADFAMELQLERIPDAEFDEESAASSFVAGSGSRSGGAAAMPAGGATRGVLAAKHSAVSSILPFLDRGIRDAEDEGDDDGDDDDDETEDEDE